jgi:hypothetical protein
VSNSAEPRRFRDADEYAEHVEHCLRRDVDVIPAPPVTPDELAVILFEHPRLAVEYLPLLLGDTDCRRAAIEFVADSF